MILSSLEESVKFSETVKKGAILHVPLSGEQLSVKVFLNEITSLAGRWLPESLAHLDALATLPRGFRAVQG